MLQYIVRKSKKLNKTWDIIDTKTKEVLSHIGLYPKYACSIRDILNGKSGEEEKQKMLRCIENDKKTRI